MKINEKSDVWGIGALMWGLISHWFSDTGPELQDRRPVAFGPFQPNEIFQAQPRIVATQYGRSITSLVTQCLDYEPSNRPALVTLKTTIAAGSQLAAIQLHDHDPDPELWDGRNIDEFAIGRKHRLG